MMIGGGGQDCNRAVLYWNPFIFVRYRNDRFFPIQILIFWMLRNNADACRCSYFELGLPVVIIVQFSFVGLFLIIIIIFLLKQFINDCLDSFVLFIFQGVQLNPSRYNLPFYTEPQFLFRIIIIYLLEQFINLPQSLSADWSFLVVYAIRNQTNFWNYYHILLVLLV